MRQLHGQSHGPLVLLHGGAGRQDADPRSLFEPTASLREMARSAQKDLAQGLDAVEVCVRCLVAMEDDEKFNAGRGAVLQADGAARLTAALMDGQRASFSGVMSVPYVANPSRLAQRLQERRARVLAPPGGELLARELALPLASNVTPQRLSQWASRLAGRSTGFSDEDFDTVGCVVRTAAGRIVAGTSTGGRGGEFPGRVSDAATVAGTYATSFAGISATGIGEEIVDDALAARIETRRRDGQSLVEACALSLREATERQRSYGWIALDQDGWYIAHTTPAMSFVVLGAQGELAASAPPQL